MGKKRPSNEPSISDKKRTEPGYEERFEDILSLSNIGRKTRFRLSVFDSTNIFCVDEFLSSRVCGQIIQWAEQVGFSSTKGEHPKRGEAYRKHGRISVINTTAAKALYGIIQRALQNAGAFELEHWRAVGVSSNFRIYRYLPGERFDAHVDQSMKNQEPAGITQLTLLIYLNGSGETVKHALPIMGGGLHKELSTVLVGGDTVFLESRKREFLRVAPKTGSALFHSQGENCKLHYAEEVQKGVKYVLRTDVVYDRM